MSTHYFRVDGADQETGEETYLVLQAQTKPHAEKLARQQGLLISSVRVAKPTDWDAAPTVVTPKTAQPAAAIEPPAQAELAQPEVAPQPEAQGQAESDVGSQTLIAPVAGELSLAQPLAPSPAVSSATRRVSKAGTVTFICVGCALIAGGVFALILAFMPDHTLRNELQQLGVQVHQLAQIVVGCTLVLAGFVAFSMAGMWHLARRLRRFEVIPTPAAAIHSTRSTVESL